MCTKIEPLLLTKFLLEVLEGSLGAGQLVLQVNLGGGVTDEGGHSIAESLSLCELFLRLLQLLRQFLES